MAKAKTNYVYHSYKTTGLLLVLYVQCMSFFVNWKLETSSTTILKNFHPLITLTKIYFDKAEFENESDYLSYIVIFQCLVSIPLVFYWRVVFRLFLATGISKSFCSNACSCALRKFCEESTTVMHDPSNLEILIWIGKVSHNMNLKI